MRAPALEALRRWRPPDAGAGRSAAAIAFVAAPALAAVALFAAFAPPASWDRPILLAALALIAAVSFLGEARLKVEGAFFDATLVLALLALALAGPLPALCVWIVPDVIDRYVIRRGPKFSPGLVATVASFALAVLAGWALLELAAPASPAAAAPALFSAGLAMWAVNFAFARLAFAPYYQGYRPGALIREEFLHLGPAMLVMVGLGVTTWLLLAPLGIAALGLLGAVIVCPQLALTWLARARSVRRMSTPAATALYGDAIADVLGVSRRDRRILALGAEEPGLQREPESTEEALSQQLAAGITILSSVAGESPGRARARMVAWAADARTPWQAVRDPDLLRLGRILAVARAWADLTARGTPQLPHEEALLGLGLRAPRPLDPDVVAAAVRVVADEGAFLREPDFAPRLQRVPLPRAIRRGGLPAVLGRLAAPA